MKQYGADDKVLLKETTEFLIRVDFFFLIDCLFELMLYTPVSIFSYFGTLPWLNQYLAEDKVSHVFKCLRGARTIDPSAIYAYEYNLPPTIIEIKYSLLVDKMS